jgi:hypothetical protein
MIWKVSKFKYLGITITKRNQVCDKFRRVNSGNASYYSMYIQTVIISLSKTLGIKI